jgi:hypothetical protein
MTNAFAGASGADLMRPAVPRFDPLFEQWQTGPVPLGVGFSMGSSLHVS